MFDDLNLFHLGRIELVAAYVALAVLLFGIILWARVRWWIRAIAIVATVGFFFVEFQSLRHMLGWPTDELLPDQFELVYAIIMEPNEVAQDPGAIYIWAMELPGEGTLDETDVYTPGKVDTGLAPGQWPRAYRLPYDRETHREVFDAQQKIVDGTRQVGTSDRRPRKPGEYAPHSEYMFYDRPDPILPPKDVQRRE